MHAMEREAAFGTGRANGVSFPCALHLAKVAANTFLAALNKTRLQATVAEIENQIFIINDSAFFALHNRRA